MHKILDILINSLLSCDWIFLFRSLSCYVVSLRCGTIVFVTGSSVICGHVTLQRSYSFECKNIFEDVKTISVLYVVYAWQTTLSFASKAYIILWVEKLVHTDFKHKNLSICIWVIPAFFLKIKKVCIITVEIYPANSPLVHFLT